MTGFWTAKTTKLEIHMRAKVVAYTGSPHVHFLKLLKMLKMLKLLKWLKILHPHSPLIREDS
jgi:hypothetical protein